MGAPDRRCGVFFGRLTEWREEMAAIRAILLDAGLDEAFKWRSPVYVLGNANVAILWNFKDHCAVGFVKGTLLTDPAGVLVAPGENSRAARKAVYRSLDEIAEGEAALRALVAEAMAVEKAGLKVDFGKDDLAYPEELVRKIEADPEFAAAFDALTPGRRRGYVLTFAGAKQPDTRAARIERHAPRILEGKGLHDR